MSSRSTPDLETQISGLRKRPWVNLQGLIDCSTALMSNLSSSPTCSSISLLGRGSYNHVYRLEFSDGTQLAASVSNQDDEDFNAQAKQSEIEAMKFVRESGLYPDIPVPKVYGWDLTFSNPTWAPYVIMDVVDGETLHDLRDENGRYGLDTLPRIQQLSIVRALAKLKASLSRPLSFNKIGSITVDTEEGKPIVGPLMTLTEKCLGGPFKSTDELWRSCLEQEILHAVNNWCNLETDELSTSLSDPKCAPQTFSEIFQLLSGLIPQFKIPKEYCSLVLHHPDLALRNIFFDKGSLLSDQPKITGVIDWGGAQILPLMLTAQYPDDLMTTADEPFPRPEYPDENWRTVPADWTSAGDASQWPETFYRENERVDYAPRVSATIRRFYLRTYFSACYAEHMVLLHGDTDLAHATLFAHAPYYLKFHETMCGGWTSWIDHASWIRETYWRLRTLSSQKTGESSLIVGPNVYRASLEPAIRDLGILNEILPSVDGDSNDVED